jgi:hypothetical protein
MENMENNNQVIGVGFQAHSTIGMMVVAALANGRIFMATAPADMNPEYAWQRKHGWHELDPIPGSPIAEAREQREIQKVIRDHGWNCPWCNTRNHPEETVCQAEWCGKSRGTRPPAAGDRVKSTLERGDPQYFDGVRTVKSYAGETVAGRSYVLESEDGDMERVVFAEELELVDDSN